MSSALDELNHKWKQFQKASTGSCTSNADISEHLLAYQQIQQDTKAAYIDWQKEYIRYQTQLNVNIKEERNDTFSPLSKPSGSLLSLINEHEELVNQIQQAIETKSSSPLEKTMQLWARLTAVHHFLSKALQQQT